MFRQWFRYWIHQPLYLSGAEPKGTYEWKASEKIVAGSLSSDLNSTSVSCLRPKMARAIPVSNAHNLGFHELRKTSPIYS